MTSTGDSLPLQPAHRSRHGWRFALVAFAATLMVAGLVAVGVALAWERIHEGRFLPGVRVAGVAVGGLDRSTADARLREALPPLTDGELTLRVGEAAATVPYAELDRRYDIERTLDRAMQVGRDGGLLERLGEQLRTATRGASLDVSLLQDTAAVDSAVDTLVADLERPLRDASVVRVGDLWSVRAAQVGVDVDADALRRAAHAAVASAGRDSGSVEVSVAPVVTEPVIATEEAEVAAAQARAVAAADLALAGGPEPLVITADVLRGSVRIERRSDGLAVVVDRASLVAAVEPLAEDLRVPAVDASFAFGDGGTIVAVPGTHGRTLDVEATADLVVASLDARAQGGPGSAVQLALSAVAPRYTTEEAQAAAPDVRRVSRWTTRYIVSDRNFFGANITVPTTRIDQQVVAPGRWFDFWKAIGKVSRAEGYGPGGAIVDGRTEPTGALAGGICSCSTTIFNAALRAGLEMGARRNHYYYIDRYPLGLDATVWKSGSGAVQTMRFRNDTPHPVLIKGINRHGKVTFELYTVPTGRTVEFTEPRVEDRRNARDTIEYTDDLPAGRTERLEYPIDGFRSWVTRIVRDATGTVLHRDTFYSRYATITGITLVGRSAGDPPDGTVVVIGG